jgi:hypothetical protein
MVGEPMPPVIPAHPGQFVWACSVDGRGPMPPVIPAHASMRLLGRWQRLLLVLLDQQTIRFF